MKEYVDKEVVCRIIDSDRSKEQMLAMLENTPIADVVEVVRCKDCKYLSRAVKATGVCIYSKGLVTISENSYCSYGERKKE